MKDTIYSEIRGSEDFCFSEEVAEVFDDMVMRSVPMYREVQEATAKLAALLAKPNTAIYDLGCSTATTLVLIGKTLRDSSIQLVGVDNAAPMLEKARKKLAAYGLEHTHLIEADIADYLPRNASVIILNYTLQFIAPEKRQAIISKLYESLLPGGALFVSEKVVHSGDQLETLITKLYYDFKRKNGYSELEIAQKRTALENVLVPFSVEENLGLLRNAGFKEVDIYLKWHSFTSFVGIKSEN